MYPRYEWQFTRSRDDECTDHDTQNDDEQREHDDDTNHHEGEKDNAHDRHNGNTGMCDSSEEESMNNHSGEGTHDHEGMPFSSLPPANAYPGTSLGTPSSGHATFVVQSLEDSHLSDTEEYVLISPRTPYNRVPLADMALSLSGAVDGEPVQTIDSEVGHHYGIEASLSPGETFEIEVEAPPQVSRHQGYETAFIEMSSMTVEVPE